MTSVDSETDVAVLHYKRKLNRHLQDESPDILLHCLEKLVRIPVSINLLAKTGIGKVVNHLKQSEIADKSVVKKARVVASKWKEIVADEEQAMSQRNEISQEDEPDEESDDQVK